MDEKKAIAEFRKAANKDDGRTMHILNAHENSPTCRVFREYTT